MTPDEAYTRALDRAADAFAEFQAVQHKPHHVTRRAFLGLYRAREAEWCRALAALTIARALVEIERTDTRYLDAQPTPGVWGPVPR